MRTKGIVLPCLIFAMLGSVRVPFVDAQLETSQGPVLAVSPEPVRMLANVPPEGLIHLDVTATDHDGKPFTGLAAQDFTLTDNGSPQKIISFATSNQLTDENERLTEVVLVLDEVNLSLPQLELIKDASIKFLHQNGGHLAQPTSVYWSTNSGLYASAAPTTNGNALAEDIAHRRSPRTVLASPHMRDPFMTAEGESHARWDRSVRAVYSIAVERRRTPGRKLLVWMGLGWPSVPAPEEHQSTTFSWLVEFSTRIREARMVISEITARTESSSLSFEDTYGNHLAGVRTPSEMEEPGFDPYSHFSLPVLALQSGGLVLDESSPMPRLIERCVADASAFYTISFNPPDAFQPDQYHDLKVRVATPGLSTRTNTGYYDQPVFYDQPRRPARQVTVHQLQQILDRADEKQDGEMAKQLAVLELSERLDSSLLLLWKSRLRGQKTIAALIALADESSFLDPPPAKIDSDPAPDLETQRQMIAKTVKYLKEVIPRLPDFFAVRTTTGYEQLPPQKTDTWKTAGADQSLHQATTQRATLRYQNGHEEQDAEKKKGRPSNRKKDLNFIGVFGPILGSVLVDASRGGSILTWGHWEQGERGREAIFRYIVRAEDPHYEVTYCCLVGGRTFVGTPRYLGKLAIDPETGAILRLTMQAQLGWIREPNLSPVLPADESGMMVEYGPVQIGGKQYVCPQRSVVIMRVRSVSTVASWGQTFEVYGPYETLLNDVVYADYHKFGSESHMLFGYEVESDAATPPAANRGSPSEPPKH